MRRFAGVFSNRIVLSLFQKNCQAPVNFATFSGLSSDEDSVKCARELNPYLPGPPNSNSSG
jgi:hypothetical protein